MQIQLLVAVVEHLPHELFEAIRVLLRGLATGPFALSDALEDVFELLLNFELRQRVDYPYVVPNRWIQWVYFVVDLFVPLFHVQVIFDHGQKKAVVVDFVLRQQAGIQVDLPHY